MREKFKNEIKEEILDLVRDDAKWHAWGLGKIINEKIDERLTTLVKALNDNFDRLKKFREIVEKELKINPNDYEYVTETKLVKKGSKKCQ